MFKIKVTKHQAINNAKKAKVFCTNLQIAIIKSLDILKQFDGKMINKKILDAINTYFKSEDIECTAVFFEEKGDKSIKYNIGFRYLQFEGEGQNYTPPDKMLLLTNDEGRLNFELTKEIEFSKTICSIIDFEKEYQDIAQNYDKYEKLVSNIYSAMKEYNEQRNFRICPYIFIN